MSEYFGKDGMTFRGKEYRGDAPDMSEYRGNGKRKPCKKDGRDSYAWDNPMTEEEARKVQGER